MMSNARQGRLSLLVPALPTVCTTAAPPTRMPAPNSLTCADKIVYAYTPIPAAVSGSSAIPGLAGLLPSLNPGLPTPLAVAMGIPQNSTPIVNYCNEQADCIYGGGIRQVCANGKGQHECQCTFSYRHKYPFCTEPTGGTAVAVGCYSFYVVCYTMVFFGFIGVLYKRIRTAKKEFKCLFSFFSTTILWGLIGSGCILAKYCYNLHEVLQPFEHPKYYLDQRTDGVLLTICGIFLPLCTNNVSMMWIEFVLASKRMASMSANLKLTKNIILGYCVFYMIAGIIFLYITVGPPEDPPDPIDTDFEYVTRGLLALNSLLTSFTYFYGGRSMYFIFAKHAEQEKTAMNNTCKTATQTSATTTTDQTDGGAAPDEDEQVKAQEAKEAKERSEANLKALQARSRMIASTTVIVGISTQIISLCLVLTTITKLYDSIEAYWFSHVLLHLALTCAAMTVVRFLNFMMGPMMPSSGGSKTGKTMRNLMSRFSKKRVQPAEAYKASDADSPAAADLEPGDISKAAAGES